MVRNNTSYALTYKNSKKLNDIEGLYMSSATGKLLKSISKQKSTAEKKSTILAHFKVR